MPNLLTDIHFDTLEFLSVVDEGEGGDETNRPAIMLIKRKLQSAGEPIELKVPIAKMDTAQRTVFGLASIITDDQGRPIVDHGDDVILAADLEKAVHAASLMGGAGKAGDMHLFKGVADVVESAVITAEKRQAARGFLGDSKAEGWWVGLKIRDEKVWQDILKGRRPELSIKIRAKRTPIQDPRLLDRVKRWLGLGCKPEEKTMPTLDEILATLPEETRNAILAHLAQMQPPAPAPAPAPVPVAMQAQNPTPAPDPEEAAKAIAKLPDDVREQIEKDRAAAVELEKKNAALEKRMEQMEKAADLAKCIEKARSDFSYLPMSADEFGAMYQAAKSSMGKVEFERWEKLMLANNEAIQKGGLFAELGGEGNGTKSGVDAEVDAAIEKINKDGKLTREQAKMAAFEADPKLYDRYLEAQQ